MQAKRAGEEMPSAGKPMSKLAQLAAARRAAAAGSSANHPASPIAQTKVEEVTKSTPSMLEPETAKPLSKLAQRVAAAKAAKAEADAKAAAGAMENPPQGEVPSSDSVSKGQDGAGMQVDEPEEQPSPLFSFPHALKDNLPRTSSYAPGSNATGNKTVTETSTGNTGPSVFFSLLTAKPKDPLVAPDTARIDGFATGGEHNPFSEPSPDDLVLKAREGTKFSTRQ